MENNNKWNFIYLILFMLSFSGSMYSQVEIKYNQDGINYNCASITLALLETIGENNVKLLLSKRTTLNFCCDVDSTGTVKRIKINANRNGYMTNKQKKIMRKKLSKNKKSICICYMKNDSLDIAIAKKEVSSYFKKHKFFSVYVSFPGYDFERKRLYHNIQNVESEFLLLKKVYDIDKISIPIHGH